MLKSHSRFRHHMRSLLGTAAAASLLTNCTAIDRLKTLTEPPRFVGGRQSDHQAGIQAGADADADAATGLLSPQFAVAQRLARLLQRPARPPDRRYLDREGQHQRYRAIPGSDEPQPLHHRGFRSHQFPRRQRAADGGEELPARLAPHRQQQFAVERHRHHQPPGPVGHQRRRGGHASAAERQHGDRGQAGGPAQLSRCAN